EFVLSSRAVVVGHGEQGLEVLWVSLEPALSQGGELVDVSARAFVLEVVDQAAKNFVASLGVSLEPQLQVAIAGGRVVERVALIGERTQQLGAIGIELVQCLPELELHAAGGVVEGALEPGSSRMTRADPSGTIAGEFDGRGIALQAK